MPLIGKGSPLITLTRKLARQVYDVFRRGLPKSVFGKPPIVLLQTDRDGLRVRAWSPEIAIEYFEPGNVAAEQIVIPLVALKGCAGSRSELVTVEHGDGDQVVLRWNDLGIPQVVAFEPSELEGEYPPVAERMQHSGDGFLTALRDAIETTDSESSRFALNCVRLRGQGGRIDATDSRQALIQAGFQFGWDDDVLVPANLVFKSAVFGREADVRIGRTENWFALQIGPWTIQLAIDKERRFPDVDAVMPAQSAVCSQLRLSDSDAQFLGQSLCRLPQDEMSNDSVTVDLNGTVAIRARAEGGAVPTELILVGSQRIGEQICINTSRRYLERAVRLGFRDVDFESAEVPAVCREGRRRYVWALLSSASMIPASESAVRIESSIIQRSQSPQTKPPPQGRRHVPARAARH